MPRLAIMSGNGYHLYIATNGWVNDEAHNSVAKAFIGMLSAKFSDDKVKVDTATANPGRLGKVPGCISRKSKEEGDRAHRMVEIENAGNALALTAKSVKALVEAEGHSTQPARAPRKGAGLDPDFDIHDFAEWCGVTVEQGNDHGLLCESLSSGQKTSVRCHAGLLRDTYQRNTLPMISAGNTGSP